MAKLSSRALSQIRPFYLVLLSQFFILLPHITHLPKWLSIYGLCVVIIQFLPIKKRIPLVKKFNNKHWHWLQMLGFILGLCGLYATYRTAFGLDVGVSFLLLCLISKLYELYTRRDAYVVMSLSLFVLAGVFLMDQGIGSTLMVMLGVLVVFYSFIAHNDMQTMPLQARQQLIHQGEYPYQHTPVFDAQSSQQPPHHTTPKHGRVRSLAIVCLLAIPLMVILFLFFPRLPPLWHINLSGAGAKTGMSDSMSPGDFANLSKSTELAFRVLFDGDIPAKNTLYWRGMVFSKFDGTTWRPSGIANNYAKISIDSQNFWLDKALYIPKKDQPNTRAFALENMNSRLYKVIMQPTNQIWLFGLDTAFSPESNISLTREYNLRSNNEISQRFTYEVRQFPDAIKDITYHSDIIADALSLPATGNPQARSMAKKLFAKVGNDPEKYSQTILNWIRKQNFSYTLSPPKLSGNRIDSFLFNTRQGFCEHYSSAYTFLMRAAGVPARVVVGYQGGELGNDGKSWEVRQMDAHAWAEIWLKNKGWVRVDPTAAISPERVNNGMSELSTSQGAALFGTGAAAQLSYQQFKLLQRMRKAMDYAGFIWQRDVVGFDQDKQENALLKWFNLKNQYQQVLAMFGLFIGLVSIVVMIQWWRRRKIWHPIDAPLIQLSKKLAKQGLARKPNEGMLTWLERVGNETNKTAKAQDLILKYRQLRYAKTKYLPEQYVQFKKQVAQFTHSNDD